MANDLGGGKGSSLITSVDPLYSVLGTFTPPQKAKFSPKERLGVNGVNIVGGYLNPPDRDFRLHGRERYVTFSEMMANITIIATAIRYFNELVGKAHWSLEPGDPDNSPAVDIADFVEDCLGDMETPFERIVRRSAGYRYYGFSIQEWILKPRDDGRLGYYDLEPRPQITIERWDCDERGIVGGVWQRTPVTGQMLYLPRGKLVYMTDDSLNSSPDGLGLLRQAYKSSQVLEKYENLETWGFETDLRGIPVAKIPYAEIQTAVDDGIITEVQAMGMRRGLEQFVTNHFRGARTGVALDSAVYTTQDQAATPSGPPKWDLQLMKAEGMSFQELAVAITRKTTDIARLFGAEHLMLGGDGQGSLALSQTGIERMYLMVNGALNEVKSAYNTDFVKPLMIFNKIDKKQWPKLKPDDIAYRSVQEVTAALLAMAQAGNTLMPDDPAIGEVRDLLGLSRPGAMNDLKAMLGDIRVLQPKPNAQGVTPGAPGSQEPTKAGLPGPDDKGAGGGEDSGADGQGKLQSVISELMGA